MICQCGDPRYGIKPEEGLLTLRKELGASVNVRPVRFPSSQVVQQSAFRAEVVEQLDITFFRDLTGGAYYGPKQEAGEDGEAYDMTIYSRQTIQSLNGVVLAENMFGDILSDQAGGILGSPDILASAAVSSIDRSSTSPGIFEPLNLKPREKLVNPLGVIQAVGLMLELSLGLTAESDALSKAIRRTLDPVELIGSDTRTADLGGIATADEFMNVLLHNLDYYLEAANSAQLAAPSPITSQPSSPALTVKRRPLSVIEKILTHAAVGLTKPHVDTGDMICVKVDWTITSELLWGGMEKTYDQMGRPRPFRNDRLWLAVDHTVDPRSNHLPRQQGLMAKAERFRREAKIIDFLPANTSIMHTDFTRERAQPGRIVVGSDSHTCSAGSMGSFAVGFGAADVVMPMVTGETWFRVPEVCRINFVGSLPFGVGGKDVILHILGLFKRNTIAFQRAVEYGGPGLKELSMDARFAIANMNTEFGGMGACFEADEETAAWIARRQHPEHREGGLYFRADPDAVYVEERTIDLSTVSVTMALYPNPDNVVPVSEKAGMELDGCFIGACTTTEEDLIIGALIIIKNLERAGMLEIYRQTGFDIGAPGCSYCVGINDVDVAGEGEVWLSSQNRNFRNRMGKGSFGNITCAAAVAASSFDMVVADPKELLAQLDRERLEGLVKRFRANVPKIFDEPSGADDAASQFQPSMLVRSKVQRFGENVDTDAIIPAEFMPGVDNADLGSHCFQYFRPTFREKASAGSRVIVAEHGFGSGSSREDAVRALQGAAVEAVIARGFAFIYERNQLNMGLFNIKLQDDEFYHIAQEDSVIVIDKESKTVQIEGYDKVFYYRQSDIEETLLQAGGVLPLYSKLGSKVFRSITMPRVKAGKKRAQNGNVKQQPVSLCGSGSDSSIDW
uniref:Isopropylmalate dehydrogenase-like domain-containing protein n=1 Tax=Bionectria ochroleuca TaxID=29856 RepID=A0A0B7KI24_BIOOC